MKIFIFTDIDGVLNPHWKKTWSKKAVEIYNRVCTDFELLPVITSTWRINHTLEQLQTIFTEQGITAQIYGYTQLLANKDRGMEIKAYLADNMYDSYVVIDDNIQPITPYVDNVVYCRSWIGLCEDSYNEIKLILKK